MPRVAPAGGENTCCCLLPISAAAQSPELTLAPPEPPSEGGRLGEPSDASRPRGVRGGREAATSAGIGGGGCAACCTAACCTDDCGTRELTWDAASLSTGLDAGCTSCGSGGGVSGLAGTGGRMKQNGGGLVGSWMVSPRFAIQRASYSTGGDGLHDAPEMLDMPDAPEPGSDSSMIGGSRLTLLIPGVVRSSRRPSRSRKRRSMCRSRYALLADEAALGISAGDGTSVADGASAGELGSEPCSEPVAVVAGESMCRRSEGAGLCAGLSPRICLSAVRALCSSRGSTPTSAAFRRALESHTSSPEPSATSSSLTVAGLSLEKPGLSGSSPAAASAISSSTMRGGTMFGRRAIATRATLSIPLHTSRSERRCTRSLVSKRRLCSMPSLVTANLRNWLTLSRASKEPLAACAW
ncbi:hypothetical protein T492DRAFT_982598 [Pavlovales sp. CCMP2436]|nr:hypothetical protein T492DRAFT_982598 [Pavlovales sp. CCMP2436]